MRTLLVGSLLAIVAAASAAAIELAPRAVAMKPIKTAPRDAEATEYIVVKFHEGTGARLRGGRLAGAGIDTAAVSDALHAAGLGAERLKRLFTRPEADLDAERDEGQRRSGRQLADLNLYYRVRVPPGTDAAALCDTLNALPFVELAAPAPRPAPAPVDLSPPTPDFSDRQSYRFAPPTGIGATDVAYLPGADGAGLKIVDIEYSWVLNHEDLEIPFSANIDSATAIDPFPDEGSHGTAVLGELVAGDNGYGVTGLVTAATLLVAPAKTAEFNYDLGRAVSLATEVVGLGDAIIIEQQICVCSRTCDTETGVGYGPVEYFTPWFDAIATATALGIAVFEPAGNGQVRLDDFDCQGRFDRSVRDSGAIIVGGGTAVSHFKNQTSSYGSRVDLQGWGQNVTTTGYGSLFDPGDVRQRYRRDFGGTSSATPIIAGAALIIQGVRRAYGLQPLSPIALRQLLASTGTPQGSPDVGSIGPLPHLPRALASFLPCVGDCDGSGHVTVDELITMVNIALGTADGSACPNGVPIGASGVEVDMIIQAVNSALTKCLGS